MCKKWLVNYKSNFPQNDQCLLPVMPSQLRWCHDHSMSQIPVLFFWDCQGLLSECVALELHDFWINTHVSFPPCSINRLHAHSPWEPHVAKKLPSSLQLPLTQSEMCQVFPQWVTLQVHWNKLVNVPGIKEPVYPFLLCCQSKEALEKTDVSSISLHNHRVGRLCM